MCATSYTCRLGWNLWFIWYASARPSRRRVTPPRADESAASGSVTSEGDDHELETERNSIVFVYENERHEDDGVVRVNATSDGDEQEMASGVHDVRALVTVRESATSAGDHQEMQSGVPDEPAIARLTPDGYLMSAKVSTRARRTTVCTPVRVEGWNGPDQQIGSWLMSVVGKKLIKFIKREKEGKKRKEREIEIQKALDIKLPFGGLMQEIKTMSNGDDYPNELSPSESNSRYESRILEPSDASFPSSHLLSVALKSHSSGLDDTWEGKSMSGTV
ncbi:hypothetical protein C8F01DRAFT_1083496 [Mycena amicta]|nr:hypothetical protein C8F01DRAFT_1083496 [Mycena amicta]